MQKPGSSPAPSPPWDPGARPLPLILHGDAHSLAHGSVGFKTRPGKLPFLRFFTLFGKSHFLSLAFSLQTESRMSAFLTAKVSWQQILLFLLYLKMSYFSLILKPVLPG